MTESEAKKKECPQHMITMVMMQIAAAKEGVSEDGILAMGKFGYCSGSACAMWEWHESFIDKDDLSKGAEYRAEGHCGLIKC